MPSKILKCLGQCFMGRLRCFGGAPIELDCFFELRYGFPALSALEAGSTQVEIGIGTVREQLDCFGQFLLCQCKLMLFEVNDSQIVVAGVVLGVVKDLGFKFATCVC